MSDVWPRMFASVAHLDSASVVRAILQDSERRRRFADYDTGSVTGFEAFCLLALVQACQARVVIEVGTFIGVSTRALALGALVRAVYTCDASNDCVPPTDVIRPYPKRSSTAMLQDLVRLEVRADVCFFDGVLREGDADLLMRVTHPDTVYAFHDYNYGPKLRKGGRLETVPRKGIGNVHVLRPLLPTHVLIDPQPETTLAVLVPESLR